MKLSYRIALPLIIFLIINSALGFIIVFSVMRNSLKKQVFEQLQSISSIKNVQLHDYLEEEKREIDRIPGDILVYLKSYDIQDKPNVDELTLTKDRLRQILTELLHRTGKFIELSLIDNQGFVYVSTNIVDEGKIRVNEDYFIQGKKETHIHGFTYDLGLQKPVLIISTPVNLSGQSFILASKVNLEKLSEIMLERTGLKETGETYLVNKFNFFVTESRFESNYALRKTIHTEATKQCLAKNDGSNIYENYRNHKVIGSYTWLDDIESCMIIEIDESEVLSSVGKMMKLVLLIAFIVVITACVFIFIVIKNLTQPLTVLKNAAQKIGEGHLEISVPINSQDEIGDLGQSVNTMVLNLRTSRQKIQDALQNTKIEKDKISAILQSIGDGVFVLDKDKKITLVNQVTQIISGYKADELIGTIYNTHLKFILDRNHQENKQFVEDVYKTGETTEMANHTSLIKKDGSKISVADSAAPLKDKDGEITGCVVVFRDVSRERNIEKMKDDFISLASHQLRTPLTAIRWYGEMLIKGIDGKLNKTQTEYMNNIYVSTKHLIELVNGLLNISRIESGRLIVNPVPTNMSDLLEKVITELKPEIDKKQQKLILRVDKNLPEINIDPTLIRQVYLNLIFNAVKYTPIKGEVSIALHLDKKSISLQVKDNGYGIPLDSQNRIYEKFFRAENIANSETSGTGLGLYMVKKIAEVSDGKVCFESLENKGTTFHFSLPLAGSKPQKGEVTLS